MNALKTLGGIVFVVIIILFFSSYYTVFEGQDALVLRLGKLEKNPTTGKVEVMQPGLHFKVPFIEHVRNFDTRLQTLDITSSRIVTEEKKYVIVDYYAKWRINNLPEFFVATGGDYAQAGKLLQQQLNTILREQFGQRTISEVVSQDRVNIMANILNQANVTAENLGIQVVDVRIKQIDLPETVTNTVYQQMRAERQRIATEHRSEGKAAANAIRAKADADVTVAIADAKAKAAQFRAEGDAKAAAIYAKAYSKDATFYAFYRSLLAYETAFSSKRDILVLKPDSQFFKYFNHSKSTRSQEDVKK